MPKFSRLAFMALALPLLGGGFYLEVGSPSASQDPKAKGAVVVARLLGCHNPETGSVIATAEGIVNGKRESIKLKTVALSTPGMFAIERQWPSEGRWALRLVGKHPTMPTMTTTLVKVQGDSFDRAGMVMKIGELNTDAVEPLLR